ncbi:hypothetical protein [Methylomicrobium lacus]|uniref:hypothetical protein n=1 Tax=Methylomicrobium lacus TaxID=136992 RepID=UPI0035A883FA
MSQLFLNPDTAENSPDLKAWKPDYPIPKHLRDWGFCPDFNAWLPGDLVLVSALKPGIIGKAIRSVQEQGGYAQDDARWEHAAVHIGSGTLCEATRKGVCVASVFDYAPNHLIRIRRNHALTQDQRWELAVNALKQQNYSYGFFSIGSILWKSRKGFWNTQGKPISFPKRAVICSELYADAHVKVCGQALGNLRSGEVTPASLSMDQSLADVQTQWVRIA